MLDSNPKSNYDRMDLEDTIYDKFYNICDNFCKIPSSLVNGACNITYNITNNVIGSIPSVTFTVAEIAGRLFLENIFEEGEKALQSTGKMLYNFVKFSTGMGNLNNAIASASEQRDENKEDENGKLVMKKYTALMPKRILETTGNAIIAPMKWAFLGMVLSTLAEDERFFNDAAEALKFGAKAYIPLIAEVTSSIDLAIRENPIKAAELLFIINMILGADKDLTGMIEGNKNIKEIISTTGACVLKLSLATFATFDFLSTR